jgi:hypothetical protein
MTLKLALPLSALTVAIFAFCCSVMPFGTRLNHAAMNLGALTGRRDAFTSSQIRISANCSSAAG